MRGGSTWGGAGRGAGMAHEDPFCGDATPVCKTLSYVLFRGKVTGFASRWSELKPRSGPSGNPAVVLSKIEEYAASIQELREESTRLQKVQ